MKNIWIKVGCAALALVAVGLILIANSLTFTLLGAGLDTKEPILVYADSDDGIRIYCTKTNNGEPALLRVRKGFLGCWVQDDKDAARDREYAFVAYIESDGPPVGGQVFHMFYSGKALKTDPDQLSLPEGITWKVTKGDGFVCLALSGKADADWNTIVPGELFAE